MSGWRGCPTPAVSPAQSLSERYSVSSLERLPSSGGISPAQVVVERCSHLRLERLPSSGGISPLKSVVEEAQMCQVGEAAKLRRYLPAQVVGVEV